MEVSIESIETSMTKHTMNQELHFLYTKIIWICFDFEGDKINWFTDVSAHNDKIRVIHNRPNLNSGVPRIRLTIWLEFVQFLFKKIWACFDFEESQMWAMSGIWIGKLVKIFLKKCNWDSNFFLKRYTHWHLFIFKFVRNILGINKCIFFIIALQLHVLENWIGPPGLEIYLLGNPQSW